MADFDKIHERNLYTNNDMETLKLLNRFHLAEPYIQLPGTKGYIFFTRPDLNLFDGETLNKDIERNPFYNDLNTERSGWHIIRSLQQGTNYPSPFIATLYNNTKGYSVNDDEIDVNEKGQTWHGTKVLYGMENIKSRSGGTISFPMSDDKNLSVYKTIKAWVDYIENVYMGIFKPRRSKIINGILDYTCSVYFIATKLDGREIVYWERLTGAFPVTVPSSAYSYTLGTVEEKTYNVTFRYAIRSKPMNPVILAEFNENAKKASKMGSYKPLYDTHNNMHGEPFVKTAYVEKLNNKYILRWD